jgi:hypothetical protein
MYEKFYDLQKHFDLILKIKKKTKNEILHGSIKNSPNLYTFLESFKNYIAIRQVNLRSSFQSEKTIIYEWLHSI